MTDAVQVVDSLGNVASLDVAVTAEGLEHLLRYALRPPLSLQRLTRAADGRVVLSLRRPLHDGTTAVAFTPMELMKRLAAIVPPPKRHSVRYFGLFAASSAIRAKVTGKPAERRRPACEPTRKQCGADLDEEAIRRALRDEQESDRTNRAPWAHLLKRVFDRQTNCWSPC